MRLALPPDTPPHSSSGSSLSHDILFGYATESTYNNRLNEEEQGYVRAIYPILHRIAEAGIAREINNQEYPPTLGYKYRGIEVHFVVKPCGSTVLIEIRLTNQLATPNDKEDGR